MTGKRVLAIIQARISSKRLPGKVLLDIAGQPMLGRVYERTSQGKLLEEVVVATTTDATDDAVESLCKASGYPCWRGSLYDVLDRYYQVSRAFQAEVVVRITADCPLIDPGLIDETIKLFFGNWRQTSEVDSDNPPRTRARPEQVASFDFGANRLPPPWNRTLPIGLDVEVCSFTALERAWKEADQPFHREHVMPFIYEGTPPESLRLDPQAFPPKQGSLYTRSAVSGRGFRVAQLHHYPDFGSLRWTVDTPEDLELVREIYARLPNGEDFTWREVLTLFENDPELALLNAGVVHKTAFDAESN